MCQNLTELSQSFGPFPMVFGFMLQYANYIRIFVKTAIPIFLDFSFFPRIEIERKKKKKGATNT
jgi:hypothetical protein